MLSGFGLWVGAQCFEGHCCVGEGCAVDVGGAVREEFAGTCCVTGRVDNEDCGEERIVSVVERDP